MRLPEHGCATSFEIKDGVVKKLFVQGEGWKRIKKREWVAEEIPDLQKPFTEDQFREYTKQYGIQCSREFLDCCDDMKPRTAWNILHPDPAAPTPDETEAFKLTFETDLNRFVCSLAWMFGIWSFDIIKFEQYLAEKFKYNPRGGNQSISDFILEGWGAEAEDLVRNLINRHREESAEAATPA